MTSVPAYAKRVRTLVKWQFAIETKLESVRRERLHVPLTVDGAHLAARPHRLVHR